MLRSDISWMWRNLPHIMMWFWEHHLVSSYHCDVFVSLYIVGWFRDAWDHLDVSCILAFDWRTSSGVPVACPPSVPHPVCPPPDGGGPHWRWSTWSTVWQVCRSSPNRWNCTATTWRWKRIIRNYFHWSLGNIVLPNFMINTIWCLFDNASNEMVRLKW